MYRFICDAMFLDNICSSALSSSQPLNEAGQLGTLLSDAAVVLSSGEVPNDLIVSAAGLLNMNVFRNIHLSHDELSNVRTFSQISKVSIYELLLIHKIFWVIGFDNSLIVCKELLCFYYGVVDKWYSKEFGLFC
ncbi:unnamed protein product [Angiostrongylus costaricensis]|uniref:NR LBD domain-containing protein n=1 Tax=Angiostrongylus costaricensis TaxID=334426 RepID=A0A0R3Q220_ANGCS|nr:unnamed protein product [Angiostrongylus costaricensis]